MKTAKYIQDYKTNADILSELKINSVVKKIQNYINKWTQHIRRMDMDRLPHLNYGISSTWETKPTTTLKRLLDWQWDRHRPKGLKSCKLYDDYDDNDDDDDDDDDCK